MIRSTEHVTKRFEIGKNLVSLKKNAEDKVEAKQLAIEMEIKSVFTFYILTTAAADYLCNKFLLVFKIVRHW